MHPIERTLAYSIAFIVAEEGDQLNTVDRCSGYQLSASARADDAISSCKPLVGTHAKHTQSQRRLAVDDILL